MTAKLTASADGSKVLIGNAAENALEIDATAKTIKALAPYSIEVATADVPAFSAYTSISTGLASGAPIKIPLETEIFDTGNLFSNSRFTAAVAGYYHFDFAVQMNVAGCRAVLMKGGAAVKAYGSSSAASTVGSSGSQLVQLAAGEYIELFVVVPVGGANVATGEGVTYLAGHLVRAA